MKMRKFRVIQKTPGVAEMPKCSVHELPEPSAGTPRRTVHEAVKDLNEMSKQHGKKPKEEKHA